MSRAVLALMLLALTASAAGAQPVQTPCRSVHEQDPDTGALIQKTRLSPKPFGFDPLLVWASDDPDSLMFVVVGNGTGLKYAGCYDLILYADGRPVTMQKLRHDSERNAPRTVVEYLRAEVPWAEAEKLAAARVISYKICKDDYHADYEFVCETKHLMQEAGAWRKEHAGKP